MSSCALLAVLSGMLLVSRVESGHAASPAQWYDRVERFALDTIRLSFTNRKLIDRDDHVYVAPVGLLDKESILVMLDGSLVYAESTEQLSATAIAPARILDSDWNPNFSPLSIQTDSR